eukprot:579678-Prorocentrum_minimum.AAC.2
MQQAGAGAAAGGQGRVNLTPAKPRGKQASKGQAAKTKQRALKQALKQQATVSPARRRANKPLFSRSVVGAFGSPPKYVVSTPKTRRRRDASVTPSPISDRNVASCRIRNDESVSTLKDSAATWFNGFSCTNNGKDALNHHPRESPPTQPFFSRQGSAPNSPPASHISHGQTASSDHGEGAGCTAGDVSGGATAVSGTLQPTGSSHSAGGSHHSGRGSVAANTAHGGVGADSKPHIGGALHGNGRDNSASASAVGDSGAALAGADASGSQQGGSSKNARKEEEEPLDDMDPYAFPSDDHPPRRNAKGRTMLQRGGSGASTVASPVAGPEGASAPASPPGGEPHGAAAPKAGAAGN